MPPFLTFEEYVDLIGSMMGLDVSECSKEDVMPRIPFVQDYVYGLYQSCNSCCGGTNIMYPDYVKEAIALGTYYMTNIFDNKENGNDDWRELCYNHLRANGGLYVG